MSYTLHTSRLQGELCFLLTSIFKVIIIFMSFDYCCAYHKQLLKFKEAFFHAFQKAFCKGRQNLQDDWPNYLLRPKRFLLEVGKLDERDFSDEILAIQLILEFLKEDSAAYCVSVGALFLQR